MGLVLGLCKGCCQRILSPDKKGSKKFLFYVLIVLFLQILSVIGDAVCVCMYISSITKSVDSGKDSIFRFSIYNIHVIQNPKDSSM